MSNKLHDSNLGKPTVYPNTYNNALLFPIPREEKRAELEIPLHLPFHGFDIWRTYELSWLDLQGKPINAIGVITIPATSVNIIESKSMKLYFNSLNQSKFASIDSVCDTIQKDFIQCLELEDKQELQVQLFTPNQFHHLSNLRVPLGVNIDHLNITTDIYQVAPSLLKANDKIIITETLNSHLLRSNCPITNQPDWATITISYTGPQIEKEAFLKYIISYRQHNEFHEQCVERIFMDLQQYCKPTHLAVLGQFTRRGGIEINPYRSNYQDTLIINSRSFFQ